MHVKHSTVGRGAGTAFGYFTDSLYFLSGAELSTGLCNPKIELRTLMGRSLFRRTDPILSELLARNSR